MELNFAVSEVNRVRMMKLFARFAAFLLLLSQHPCFADPIKIGMSVPLTGPAATYGTDIKNVVMFLNDRQQGEKFAMIVEDDKCDPKEAVTIAQKFTQVDRVSAVIGLPCSSTMLAAAQTYERAKTVAISAGAGAISISSAGDYIFRARPSDAGSATLLAGHITKIHKHIGILAEETEYAQGLADAFTKAAAGIKITRVGYLPSDTDLNTHLLKIRAMKVDALLLLAQAEGRLAVAVKSLRSLQWHVATYSSIFPGSPSFLKLVKRDADEIIFSTLPTRSSLTREGVQLLNEFEKSYGALHSVDYIFPVTFAAFTSLKVGLSEADLKQALYSKSFSGLLGPFSYDLNGDLIGMNYMLMHIKDQKPVRNVPGLSYSLNSAYATATN